MFPIFNLNKTTYGTVLLLNSLPCRHTYIMSCIHSRKHIKLRFAVYINAIFHSTVFCINHPAHVIPGHDPLQPVMKGYHNPDSRCKRRLSSFLIQDIIFKIKIIWYAATHRSRSISSVLLSGILIIQLLYRFL